jgi:hypothetical protein
MEEALDLSYDRLLMNDESVCSLSLTNAQIYNEER